METIKSKISLRDLGLTREKLTRLVIDLQEGQAVDVAVIVGKVNDYQLKANKDDPTKFSHQFKGTIEMTSLLTGEVVYGKGGFLPGSAGDFVADELDANEGGTVEFGIKVQVVKAAKAATGYMFNVQIPERPKQSDPLAHLRERLGIAGPVTPLLPDASEPVTEAEAVIEPAKGKGKKAG